MKKIANPYADPLLGQESSIFGSVDDMRLNDAKYRAAQAQADQRKVHNSLGAGIDRSVKQLQTTTDKAVNTAKGVGSAIGQGAASGLGRAGDTLSGWGRNLRTMPGLAAAGVGMYANDAADAFNNNVTQPLQGYLDNVNTTFEGPPDFSNDVDAQALDQLLQTGALPQQAGAPQPNLDSLMGAQQKQIAALNAARAEAEQMAGAREALTNSMVPQPQTTQEIFDQASSGMVNDPAAMQQLLGEREQFRDELTNPFVPQPPIPVGEQMNQIAAQQVEDPAAMQQLLAKREQFRDELTNPFVPQPQTTQELFNQEAATQVNDPAAMQQLLGERKQFRDDLTRPFVEDFAAKPVADTFNQEAAAQVNDPAAMDQLLAEREQQRDLYRMLGMSGGGAALGGLAGRLLGGSVDGETEEERERQRRSRRNRMLLGALLGGGGGYLLNQHMQNQPAAA